MRSRVGPDAVEIGLVRDGGRLDPEVHQTPRPGEARCSLEMAMEFATAPRG